MAETIKFDHYEVLNREDGSPQELGRGAMGVTYKAFDTNLRIPVALKVINAASINSELARQRFIREARAAAALRHPNVASVFHLGIKGDIYFYAMEFVDGETIESLIHRNGPVAPALAAQIIIQVARALTAAAKLELVHRDIKPANLMILHQDEEHVVKVIDFGLAKSSKGDGDDLATVSMGGFVGTPYFASPEQLEEKDLDIRSDIYSLGITLWYMLAGRTPFAGTLAQVMSQHLSKIPPFEQLNLPSPMVYLLKRMLEKDPADRFQTPTELRKEAEKCAEMLKAGETLTGSIDTTGASGSGLATGEDETLAGTIAGDIFPTVAAEPQSFQIGSIIANRYEVVEKPDDCTCLAQIRGTHDQARLFLLRKAASVESKVRQAAALQHPNLLRCYGLEEFGGTKFIALEAAPGFTLLDLLRARRQLSAGEVGRLLEQAAEAGDFLLNASERNGGSSQTQGRLMPDLSLSAITLALPEGEGQELLRLSLDQWPRVTLKLNPIRIEGSWCLASGGQQTIVRERPESPKSPESAEAAAKQLINGLGLMAYELLGGNVQQILGPADAPVRYVPLAALSEKGNAVLKQALDSACPYASAKEFFDAFKAQVPAAAVQSQQPLHSSRAQALHQPPSLVEPVGSSGKSDSALSQGDRKSKASGKIWLGAGACVVFVGIVAGVIITRKPSLPQAGTVEAPKKSAVVVEAKNQNSEPAKPAEEKPVVVENKATPSPTPQLVVVAATPAPTPVVQPTPSQEELLKKRLDAAKQLEAEQDWKGALHEYVQIETDFPKSDAARVALEVVIPELDKQIDKNDKDGFDQIRDDLTKAARTEVVSAMMLLGRGLQKREPALAFSWFQSAAEKGYAPAMRQAGLMYSNGNGVARDWNRAFVLFEQAAGKGDVASKFLLGECLFYGKGTTKDQKRAVSILSEAAGANEPRAMNLLGTCYQRGFGTKPDYEKALELFRKAGEAGIADAFANEGVLYMNGEGVKKDAKHGATLIQKGVDAGSSTSMFLLGKCYECGAGVDENLHQAFLLYKKAGEAGVADALAGEGNLLLMGGAGVDKDENQGAQLIQKGADAGSSLCMFLLGQCYENGTGVAKNHQEAVLWYRKSAQGGNRQAAEWCKQKGINF